MINLPTLVHFLNHIKINVYCMYFLVIWTIIFYGPGPLSLLYLWWLEIQNFDVKYRAMSRQSVLMSIREWSLFSLPLIGFLYGSDLNLFLVGRHKHMSRLALIPVHLKHLNSSSYECQNLLCCNKESKYL